MAKPQLHKCKFFIVYRPYKESIPKKMNNDNDLNMHLHDQIVKLASLLGKGLSMIETSNSAYNIQDSGRSYSQGGRGNFTYLLEGQINFALKLSVGCLISQF